jgi:hypothetical protein
MLLKAGLTVLVKRTIGVCESTGKLSKEAKNDPTVYLLWKTYQDPKSNHIKSLPSSRGI